MSLPEPLRKSQLAKIHIAKKQLKLTDEDYRAMLVELTGKDSAKDMDAADLTAVLSAMRRMGFKAATPQLPPLLQQDPGVQTEAEFVDHRPVKLSPVSQGKVEKTRLDKIRALWIDGHGKGIIKRRGEEALVAFAKRLTGVDRLEWLTSNQQNSVIQALVKMGCGTPEGQRSPHCSGGQGDEV